MERPEEASAAGSRSDDVDVPIDVELMPDSVASRVLKAVAADRLPAEIRIRDV